MPDGVADDIIKGLYKIRSTDNPTIRLLGSGPLMGEILAAADLLKNDWDVEPGIWNVTSFSELRRDAEEVERGSRRRCRLATGEVLGQRPMSQRLNAFRSIEKLAGLRGMVLRPLSGKLLPETVYEKEGLVKREEMLDLKGRSRKRYPEILAELGVDYENLPTPSGGCLLTDPAFSKKVKDLMEHDQLDWKNVKLLKVGRHFRLGNCKLVVGRNRKENEELSSLAEEGDFLLKAVGVPSPTGLLRCGKVEPDEDTLRLAASIVARYSDARKEEECGKDPGNELFREEVGSVGSDGGKE
jgi:hypothetical protein